ncbi:deoxyribodipyrimidine photolyase [Pedobacter ginsengisoli]|uniref:Cryptochrome DASH n=1 Tax=Pedobacter ginsengisoli TaxID=363852 RepID=A0A2D1U8A0_9SPHI|nr:DASH family cryptochrome [Pedobacter ginsengisoli]ATP57826.1 deoxyribodipyrimidine photolyase [Pedobacter ginsengisoli]
MKSKKILVWFRNDLRLHDNEMLVEAIAKSDCILPIYFFDPRYFESTSFETEKTGARRAQFLLESVLALRTAFQKLGGDILLIQGKPEEHIPIIVEQLEISEVYHHREVGPEETLVSGYVEDALWKQRVNLKHFIGHTLYNKEDLPFPIKDIPDVFTQFKKKTERDAIVKSCFESPLEITFAENENWGALPSLLELGLAEPGFVSFDNETRGGELDGLEHLTKLLEPGSEIYTKYSSKVLADKQGFTSKISGWLSFGCLSPRKVYWMVKEAEASFGPNPNFNQILLGLLWRDYFRFMFKKHGIKFFQEPDFEEMILSPVEVDVAQVKKWKNGETGHLLVDKYMKELNDSGFIPHAARLVVATFLIHVLKVHWTIGAAYFEEKLIDYAPASNWGNWANVAGAGLDLKSKNTFDLDKQMKILDVVSPDTAPVA